MRSKSKSVVRTLWPTNEMEIIIPNSAPVSRDQRSRSNTEGAQHDELMIFDLEPHSLKSFDITSKASDKQSSLSAKQARAKHRAEKIEKRRARLMPTCQFEPQKPTKLSSAKLLSLRGMTNTENHESNTGANASTTTANSVINLLVSLSI